MRLRFLPALALLVALVAGGAAAPAQAQATRVLGCGADYQVVVSWATGFQSQVDITNTGTVTINRWQATVTLPNGTFTNGWSATYTIVGNTIIIDPQAWNATIPPGGTVPVGFIGTGDGTPSGVSITCTT